MVLYFLVDEIRLQYIQKYSNYIQNNGKLIFLAFISLQILICERKTMYTIRAARTKMLSLYDQIVKQLKKMSAAAATSIA